MDADSASRLRFFSVEALRCRHASTWSARFSWRKWREQIGHDADAALMGTFGGNGRAK
jgi:hypothetical protein